MLFKDLCVLWKAICLTAFAVFLKDVAVFLKDLVICLKHFAVCLKDVVVCPTGFAVFLRILQFSYCFALACYDSPLGGSGESGGEGSSPLQYISFPLK